MELYLTRLFDMSRLTPTEKSDLQTRERSIGRILMPHEVQKIFKLNPHKDAYEIPDVEAAQGSYMKSVKNQLSNNNVLPEFDFSIYDIDRIHAYDEQVTTLLYSGKINLMYVSGRERRKHTDSYA